MNSLAEKDEAARTASNPIIFDNLVQSVAEENRVWEPFRAGIEISRIYSSTGGGPAAALLRFQAGAMLPRHRHSGWEHIFVIKGTQTDDNGDHLAGAAMIHPPGTSHQVSSRNGCIVLAIWEKPVQFHEEGKKE